MHLVLTLESPHNLLCLARALSFWWGWETGGDGALEEAGTEGMDLAPSL